MGENLGYTKLRTGSEACYCIRQFFLLSWSVLTFVSKREFTETLRADSKRKARSAREALECTLGKWQGQAQ